MFPSIAGLPAHPLLVHAAVVAIPLAALAALVVAVTPRLRARFGRWALGLVALGLAGAVLAEESGQTLADQLPPGEQIETHQELAEALPPMMFVLLLLLAALMFLDRRTRQATAAPAPTAPAPTAPAPTAPGPAPTALRALAVVLTVATVVLAAGALVQVVRVGDSGARATWGDVGEASAMGPAPLPAGNWHVSA